MKHCIKSWCLALGLLVVVLAQSSHGYDCTADEGKGLCNGASSTSTGSLNGAKYCCLNAIGDTPTLNTNSINGVTSTSCTCSPGSINGIVGSTSGNECVADQGSGRCRFASFTSMVAGVKYCCSQNSQWVQTSSDISNGVRTVSCKCYPLTNVNHVSTSGTDCMADQRTGRCNSASSTSITNGKLYCCPDNNHGMQSSAYSVKGVKTVSCKCFAGKPPATATFVQRTMAINKNTGSKVNPGSTSDNNCVADQGTGRCDNVMTKTEVRHSVYCCPNSNTMSTSWETDFRATFSCTCSPSSFAMRMEVSSVLYLLPFIVMAIRGMSYL